MSNLEERGIGLICFLGKDRNDIARIQIADFGGDVSPYSVAEIDFLKLKLLNASERAPHLQALVDKYFLLLFVGVSNAELRFIAPVIHQLRNIASQSRTTISRISDGSALLDPNLL